MLGAPHLAHAAGAELRRRADSCRARFARASADRAASRATPTARRMRTRFHANISATPSAIASAPPRRDQALLLEPLRRTEQRALGHERREVPVERRRDARRACRRPARPTRGSRRRRRASWKNVSSRDRRRSPSAANSASSAGSREVLVPQQPVLLRRDRPASAPTGTRGSCRRPRTRRCARSSSGARTMNADSSLTSKSTVSHRAQRAIVVVDRLGDGNAGLVRREERARRHPHARLRPSTRERVVRARARIVVGDLGARSTTRRPRLNP